MKDNIYMKRCIQLALNGENSAAPNPMVGCVIVHNDKIIGEGYHVRCGEAHAEVNAIRSVKDPSKLKDSTIYVSLEPCSHYGKTPPCVDLILEKQIPRIVVGCKDPFEKVAGTGIEKLKKAGRKVTVGVLEEECKELIRHFVVFNTLHRPYLILKWAESADGFLDLNRSAGKPVRLSTNLTSMVVHKKRAAADAIMVGTRTAMLDNPSLTVRNWCGRNPVRIVPDRYLSLPPELNLFDGSVPALVYTTKERESFANLEYVTLKNDSEFLFRIMDDLYKRNIQTVLVEGGSALLQSLIDSGLWDEISVEKSSKILGSGVKSPEISNENRYSIKKYFGEFIWHYTNERH